MKSFNNLFSSISAFVNAPTNIPNGADFFEDEKLKQQPVTPNKKRICLDETDGSSKDDLITSKTGKEDNDYYNDFFDFQMKRTGFEFSSDFLHKDNNVIHQSSELEQKDSLIFKISHIEYLPFFKALKYDKRTFNRLFIELFCQKVFVFRAIIKRSKFEMRSLNISIYFLYIVSIFTFNALTFSNGMILNKYNEKEGNDIWVRALLSLLISLFLYFGLMKVLGFYYIIEAMLAEITNRDTVKILTNRTISKMKLKVIGFYLFDIVVITFCWYYLVAFTTVYKYCRMDWLLGGVLSILLMFIYNSVLIIVITILTHFGLTIYSKNMYHSAIFLQKYL